MHSIPLVQLPLCQLTLYSGKGDAGGVGRSCCKRYLCGREDDGPSKRLGAFASRGGARFWRCLSSKTEPLSSSYHCRRWYICACYISDSTEVRSFPLVYLAPLRMYREIFILFLRSLLDLQHFYSLLISPFHPQESGDPPSRCIMPERQFLNLGFFSLGPRPCHRLPRKWISNGGPNYLSRRLVSIRGR